MIRAAWVALGIAALVGPLAPAWAGLVPSFPELAPQRAPGSIDATALTPYQKRVREGLEQFSRGDLAGAEKTLIEAIKLDPKDPAARLVLAQIATNANRPKDADRWIDEAQRAAPKSPEVAIAAGRLAASRGNTVTAERLFREAASFDPKSPGPRIDLGDLYLNTGRAREAADAFKSALTLSPDHAGAHFGLGRAQVALKDQTTAQKTFERAGVLAPNNPLPWLAIAELHVAARAFDPALAACDQAINASPEFLPAHIAKADVLAIRGGASKQALDAYQAAFKFAPGAAAGPVHLKIGMLLDGDKRFDEADRAYQAAIEADPRLAVAYNNRAWLAVQRKRDLDNALAWAKKAVEINPKIATFHDTLGAVYLARQDADAAVGAARTAIKLDERAPGHQYTLGLALEQKRANPEAVEAYRKALDLKQDFPQAADAKRRIDALTKR